MHTHLAVDLERRARQHSRLRLMQSMQGSHQTAYDCSMVRKHNQLCLGPCTAPQLVRQLQQ
jgi:hypothetical protein